MYLYAFFNPTKIIKDDELSIPTDFMCMFHKRCIITDMTKKKVQLTERDFVITPPLHTRSTYVFSLTNRRFRHSTFDHPARHP